MKKEEVKKFTFRHLEKLTFGAASLIVLIYLISLAITRSGAQENRDRLDEVIRKVEELKVQTKSPALQPSQRLVQTEEQFKIVPPSESAVTWLFHKIPFLPRKAKIAEEEDRMHLEPELTLEPEIYSVRLKWQPNPGNAKVTIVGYRIMRIFPTDPLEKAIVVVDQLAPDVTTYEDKNVQPDETYKYWVEELAREDETKGKPLKDKIVQSKFCEVVTKSNIEISGDIIFDNPERPTKAMVQTTFTKPDGTPVTDRSTWMEKGKDIILFPNEESKRINTGWKVEDLGQEDAPAGKTRPKFVRIKNLSGKIRTIYYPPDRGDETPP